MPRLPSPGEQAAAQHPKILDITSYSNKEVSDESTEMWEVKQQVANEHTDKHGIEGSSPPPHLLALS